MTNQIIGPTGSQRRRWTLLIPLVAAFAFALVYIAGAQGNAPDQAGLFELDKNAINDEQTPSFGTDLKTLGTLGGNINASVTSFTVCQNVDTPNPTTPILIQIDAERMTVPVITNAGGGGCQGAFKRTYGSAAQPIVRGDDGTTAASHGASGVSGYVTQVTKNAAPGDDWDQV
ncbi:MAG: hypothetical protein ACRDNP_10550, partial [Gaiellaceae bacterium]